MNWVWSRRPRRASCFVPAPAPASPPPAPVARPAAPRSDNVLRGSAFLRAQNGQYRSCAGSPVRLFPVDATTEAFVGWTFGTPTGGFSRRTGWEPQPFDRYALVTTCDAQGEFAFDRLPDGDYFVAVVVSIETMAGGAVSYVVQEGGTIAARVSLAGGVVQTVKMTR